ncbi:hypothetical protein JCM3765_000187 [Sporobolomyces pararoseus]
MLFSRALLVSIALAPLALAQDSSDDLQIFPQAPTECKDVCNTLEEAAMGCSVFGGSETEADIERCLCEPDFGSKFTACKSCATPLLDKDSDLSTTFAQFEEALANNCSSISTSSSSPQATTVDETSASSSAMSSSASSRSSAASSSSSASSTSTQSSSGTNTASGSPTSPSQSGDSGNGASSVAAGGIVSLLALIVAVVAI